MDHSTIRSSSRSSTGTCSAEIQTPVDLPTGSANSTAPRSRGRGQCWISPNPRSLSRYFRLRIRGGDESVQPMDKHAHLWLTRFMCRGSTLERRRDLDKYTCHNLT